MRLFIVTFIELKLKKAKRLESRNLKALNLRELLTGLWIRIFGQKSENSELRALNFAHFSANELNERSRKFALRNYCLRCCATRKKKKILRINTSKHTTTERTSEQTRNARATNEQRKVVKSKLKQDKKKKVCRDLNCCQGYNYLLVSSSFAHSLRLRFLRVWFANSLTFRLFFELSKLAEKQTNNEKRVFVMNFVRINFFFLVFDFACNARLQRKSRESEFQFWHWNERRKIGEFAQKRLPLSVLRSLKQSQIRVSFLTKTRTKSARQTLIHWLIWRWKRHAKQSPNFADRKQQNELSSFARLERKQATQHL